MDHAIAESSDPSGLETSDGVTATKGDLRRRVAPYQTAQLWRSLLQVATSLGGFLAVCAAMYAATAVSGWLVLAMAPLAAGFLVRTFIVQHDCGHGAFFRSRRANDILGFVCSLFTLTPYLSWRRQHAGHHGVWNNLDRRDTGVDIYSTCLTVAEYRALGAWPRFWYRATRHPLFANLVLPPLVFMVLYRLPFDLAADWRRERRGVWLTDLALVAVYGGLGFVFGFGTVALVQIPVMLVASIVGVWLFTVQHRGETVAWAREAQWSGLTASLEGTTWLDLPRILQWFTGNIGLHHIHHLNPRIPNYRLQSCQDAVGGLAGVERTSLGGAFRAMFCTLWDEPAHRMVTPRMAMAGMSQAAAAG